MARIVSHRFLAVWLPWWPAERLARRRPEVRSRPFVAVSDARGRQVVASANRRAARAGLVPGMSLADARAIVPEVVARAADPAADARALESLARWAFRFTPRVAPAGPDAILLDVGGCAHLFGGERALASSVRARLKGFGLASQAGLAGAPGAAWALARYGGGALGVVPAGAGLEERKKALGGLPVAALRLNDGVAEALASFGLDKIHTLFDMQSAELAKRFGPGLPRRLAQVLGLLADPIAPLRPLPSRDARLAFAEPVSRIGDIRAALDKLLDDLCATLRRSGEGARRVRLVCRRVDQAPQAVEVATSRPLRSKESLMGLFAEKLERVAPGFGIEEMTLAAEATETVAEEQAGWTHAEFAGETGEDMRELAALADRLGNRFGFDRIVRPTARQSWMPERAVRFGALDCSETQARQSRSRSGREPDARGQAARPPATAEAGWPADRPRPVRLASPPEPVQVAVCRDDGAPVSFRRRGRLHWLRRAEGPERMEAEWWRQEAPGRDYYVVEDQVGGRYWLYRELPNTDARPVCGERAAGSRWFLHGVFG